MVDKDVAIIETKLDILIADFQAFKLAQTKHNESRRQHADNEDIVQAQILTTQKWHTKIGAFMMTALLYLLYQRVVG